MPDVFSDEEIGLTPLSDEDIGLVQFKDTTPNEPFVPATPSQPPAPEQLTTYGGPPKQLASAAETLLEPKEAMLQPRVTLPKFQLKESDPAYLTAGKEAANVLTGVPEFMSSNVGILGAVTGSVAPVATAGAFTLDMLHSLGQQVKSTYKNWDNMTPTQKTAAIVDMVATGGFAALLGKTTVKGLRPKPPAPVPLPDIPGINLETPQGAPAPRPEAIAAIERATPEQAAAQAEQMAARFEEKPATEPSILAPEKSDISTQVLQPSQLPNDIPTLINLRKQLVQRLDEIQSSEQQKFKGTAFEGQSRFGAVKQTNDLLTDVNTKLSDLGAKWNDKTQEFEAPEKPEVAPVVEATKPEVTPLPKLSNKAIGTTWNKLVSTARGDLDELILNWNTGELSPDGSKITVPIGRDRTDNVNVSKKSFFQWLYSDDPLDPKSFDQSQQWVDLVNRTRENAGLKPKEVAPVEKPVEEPAKPAAETKAVEPLSDEQIGLTKQPWEMTLMEIKKKINIDRAYTRISLPGDTFVTVGDEALHRNEPNADVAKSYHKAWIRGALSEGKLVPAEVLADYPDLKPAPKPAEAPVEAVKVAEENNAPNIAKAEEQPIVGMGGAVPAEFQPQTQMQSAIKNAAVDRDRMERGEPPMMSALRKSDPELWAQAMNIVDQDAAAADKLIARHQSNPFIPTDVESMVLLHRRVDLKNEFNKAHREALLAEQEGRPEAAEAAKAVRDAMGEKLNELDTVTGKGETAQGTMAGRAFRARQLVMNQDFSMAELVTRREADLGRKLTDEEIAQLQKISDDNARLNNEYAALLEAHEKNQAAADMRKAIADSDARQKQLPYHPRILELAENYAKKWDERGAKALADLKALFGTDKPMFSGAPISPEMLDKAIIYGTSKIVRGVVDFAKWSDEMIRDIGPAFAEYTDRVWKAANEAFDKDVAEAFKKQGTATVQKVKGALKKGEFGKDTIVKKIRRKVEESKGVLPDLKYYLDRLLDYHVRQGLREEGALLDAIHEDVKTVIPDITRRETREILAGYGTPVKPLPKDVVSVIKRDMHGQWQEISKIDMIRRGIFPPKLQERATMSPKQRWLRKQYEAEKRLHPEVLPTDAEGQLKSAMQAAKTRITNQITDLEHQIVTKTKIVKETKRLKPDAELQRLIAIRDEMKAVYDTVFKKPDLTDAERLDIWMERTKDRIAELTEKVKNKDFLPRKKPEPIRLNPEAIKLNFELPKLLRPNKRFHPSRLGFLFTTSKF